MGGRICRKCDKDKDITCFYKNGKQGRLWTCSDCRREATNAKHRRYYKLYPEKHKSKRAAEYLKNKEYYAKKYREWQARHPDRTRGFAKKSYRKKRERIPFRLSSSMSGGMFKSLKRGKDGYHWESLVNFTVDDLKCHLESQFTKGMTWDNYGKWHIDHIIPRSFFVFDSFDDVEFKMCWRLENLQPLWAVDNLRKSNKIARAA